MRQEKKFIFQRNEILAFERHLIRNGFRCAHLPNYVNNIYLEGKLLESAMENIEGDSLRVKHRIRWYNDNVDTFVLEAKIKKSSSGYKESNQLISCDLEDAINEAQIATRKRAIIQNRYFRKYYTKGKIRVTIDSDLSFNRPNQERLKHFRGCIVEIKFNTSDMHNSSELMIGFSQLSKFSKYLHGLEVFNLIH